MKWNEGIIAVWGRLNIFCFTKNVVSGGVGWIKGDDSFLENAGRCHMSFETQ